MNELTIGTVTRVRTEGIEVAVTVDSMNVEHEGRTYRIGQVGSLMALPMETHTLIGFVTGIGRSDQRSEDGKARQVMTCQLLGRIKGDRFERGVNEYPTIGDEVRIAVRRDFEMIFGSMDASVSGTGGGARKTFRLGQFALNTDFDVQVLGKEFFSKHAALLGNSGSGKSCATAKILEEITRLSDSQAILFDLHGEYSAAFSDESGRLNPNVTYHGERDLIVPYWLLKYEEMESLFVDHSNPLHVSPQISFLKTAMTELKAEAVEALGIEHEANIDSPVYFSLDQLKIYGENLNDARYVLNSEQLAFAKLAHRSLPPAEQAELMRIRRMEFNKGAPEGEVPHMLYHGKLLGLINQLDMRLNDRRYDFMLRPIQQAKNSPYYKDVLRETRTPLELSEAISHLLKVMTGRLEPRRNLTIVDLSGIPFDVVDVTVAVITRLIFEFNFWSPPAQRHPIVMVYEEAHNYISRRSRRREDKQSFARTAVERVAKEGRKYGVSAMIISQRPSELSETVLSQCNSMIVLRLNNPDDQAYVAKVVSDQYTELVRALPILRPGEGFVIGDSVLMPLRTLIDLPTRLPRSDDMDFFRHWSAGTPDADIDSILEHWWRQDRRLLNAPVEQGAPNTGETQNAAGPSEGDNAGESAEPAGTPAEADEAPDVGAKRPTAAPARRTPVFVGPVAKR